MSEIPEIRAVFDDQAIGVLQLLIGAFGFVGGFTLLVLSARAGFSALGGQITMALCAVAFLLGFRLVVHGSRRSSDGDLGQRRPPIS